MTLTHRIGFACLVHFENLVLHAIAAILAQAVNAAAAAAARPKTDGSAVMWPFHVLAHYSAAKPPLRCPNKQQITDHKVAPQTNIKITVWLHQDS